MNQLKIQKFVVFVKKYWKKNAKDKKCCKVRDHCHYTGEYRRTAHSICNLKYNAPKIIPIAFHLKDLAENFKKQFTCLGEKTAKCLTFVFLIEKEVARIDKKIYRERSSYIKYILHILIYW